MTTVAIERAGLEMEQRLRERVKSALRRRGWTVRGAAKRAGLAPTTINPWVLGQRHMGTRQLCRVLALLELDQAGECVTPPPAPTTI